MFSIIFFVFVAVILAGGFFAATWRRKNKVPLDPDGTVQRNSEHFSRSNTTFNKSTGDVKGEILPAENKLSRNDVNEEDDLTK